MSLQIKVPLPENLYQQVKRWADTRHQEVGEAIAAYLADAFKTELSNPRLDPEIEPERVAFLRLHPDLWKQYSNQYVAIYGGNLVDHDPDKVALLKRVDMQYPGVFVLVYTYPQCQDHKMGKISDMNGATIYQNRLQQGWHNPGFDAAVHSCKGGNSWQVQPAVPPPTDTL